MLKKDQIKWLNCAKLVAILAVMVDHTNGLLYTNQDIAYASYYSVSLFVLVSGMTMYLSNSNHDENWAQSVIRGSKKIVIAYCIATAVYMIWQVKAFDFIQYLNYLVHFNISAPHYFVLLYLQLMLVNRFLYNFLQKCSNSLKGYLAEAGMLIAIMIFASWSTNYTNILGVYGGGGKLFGGTYLILYYFGMIVMKHGWLADTSAIKSASLLIGFGAIWFFFWRFVCRNGLVLEIYVPYGGGYNPPSITFCIFALCVLPITFGLFTLLSRNKYTKWITDIANQVGKYTMSIFLYHLLVLWFVLCVYLPSLPTENIWLARFVYFLGMILGSIFIEIIVTKVQKFIIWVLKGNKTTVV